MERRWGSCGKRKGTPSQKRHKALWEWLKHLVRDIIIDTRFQYFGIEGEGSVVLDEGNEFLYVRDEASVGWGEILVSP